MKINIFFKGYDLSSELVFEDICELNSLMKAIVQCINSNPELRSNKNIERLYFGLKLHLKH